MNDCSLEKVDLGIYFSIKMFLDQCLEEKIEGEKSRSFAILEISLPFLLSKYHFIVPFVVFLDAHVSGSNISKGFQKWRKIEVSEEV